MNIKLTIIHQIFNNVLLEMKHCFSYRCSEKAVGCKNSFSVVLGYNMLMEGELWKYLSINCALYLSNLVAFLGSESEYTEHNILKVCKKATSI